MGLSVKAESLPQSQVALEISVGKEECQAAWNSVILDLSKRAKISGFRKGKVPQQIIISQFGRDTIKASACEEVIEKSIKKALSDSGINAVGQAILDEGEADIDGVVAKYSPEEPLTFRIKIDVWPEAKITGSYDNLDLTAEEAPFDESVIDSALEELRRKEAFSVLAAEGSKARLGGIVVANMHGFYRKDDDSKGDPLPDVAKGDMVEIKMREGQYMPGFVEGIVGMGVGETRSVNVQFPLNSARPELAGAKAIFDVTVHAVKDEVLPELNDDFAMKATESLTLKDLREKIRERLGIETENITKGNINRAVEDALVAITDVALPETMVEERVKTKFANMLADFKERGMSDDQVKAMVTKENYELYKKRARQNVERSLTANFAITTIARQLGVKVDKQDIEDQMMIARKDMKGEEIDEEKVRDQIEAHLERDLVLEHIKKSAKITLTKPKPADISPEKQTAAAQT